MAKAGAYRVKITVGDATVEVEGAESGVVKIVEAISDVLRGPRKTGAPLPGPQPPGPPISKSRGAQVDIRSFFEEKAPSSDVEAAAVAAYYYQYLAPEPERRDTIDAATLQNAFRLGKRPLPAHARFTLQNTRNAGYFDSTGEAGQYRLNTVGYNLVEHTLGRKEAAPAPSKRRPKRRGKKARSR